MIVPYCTFSGSLVQCSIFWEMNLDLFCFKKQDSNLLCHHWTPVAHRLYPVDDADEGVEQNESGAQECHPCQTGGNRLGDEVQHQVANGGDKAAQSVEDKVSNHAESTLAPV